MAWRGSSGVAFLETTKNPVTHPGSDGEDYYAYAVRVDVLAFGSARGSRDRVGVRRHSVRYEVRAVGRGRRLHHPRDRMQGQNGLSLWYSPWRWLMRVRSRGTRRRPRNRC